MSTQTNNTATAKEKHLCIAQILAEILPALIKSCSLLFQMAFWTNSNQ